MNLAIDIGNSWVKCAVVEDGQVVETFRTERPDASYIEGIIESYPHIDSAIMINGREEDGGIGDMLHTRLNRFILFDISMPVPVVNLYRTPETLGADRLAAAVGANTLYSSNNVMVVDFGTALTIDVVTSRGEYLGGNISPGAETRFKALNQFTGKLPLRSLPEQNALIGKNSAEAIENGVAGGIIYEIEGYIRDLGEKYDDLRIIFTGGESNYFAKRFKNTIFVNSDLVVYGLNRILEYNKNAK